MADLPGVVELLDYMLVRDPCRRPSLSDIASRYIPPEVFSCGA